MTGSLMTKAQVRVKASFPRSVRGVSLIELMIALVLGLLVTAGILQLFVGNKQTHMSNEALARVQENARFSIEEIKREFRTAGTHGFCAARLQINNHLNPGCPNYVDAIFDASQAFIGWEYSGTGRNEAHTIADLDPADEPPGNWTHRRSDGTLVDLPEFLEDRVVPGSDVVVIRRLVVIPGVTGSTTAKNNPGQASIGLNGGSTLFENEIVLVTNCTTGADLFQNMSAGKASAVSTGKGACNNPGPGNLNNVPWSTSYDDTMQMYRVRSMAYYVGFNEERQEPGLYRADISRGLINIVHEELAEGIETMQVLFGYSLPGDEGGDGQSVDFWLTAAEVTNWEFIIGARAAFLIRSPESAGDGRIQRTYDLAGTAVTHPEDNRLRQPFSVSVGLRNRQIVL